MLFWIVDFELWILNYEILFLFLNFGEAATCSRTAFEKTAHKRMVKDYFH